MGAFQLVLASQLVCPEREPAVDFVADVLIELRMLVETQRSVDLRTLPVSYTHLTLPTTPEV